MNTSTLTVTDFVLARIAEDEATARGATDGPWKVDDETYAEYIGSPSGVVVSGSRWGGEASVFDNIADAIHITRHDPARVLAQCAAMRKIVNAHRAGFPDGDRYAMGWHDLHGYALIWLAAIWSDHPDWREEWR